MPYPDDHRGSILVVTPEGLDALKDNRAIEEVRELVPTKRWGWRVEDGWTEGPATTRLTCIGSDALRYSVGRA